MMFLATKLQSYLIIHVTREYRYGRRGGIDFNKAKNVVHDN